MQVQGPKSKENQDRVVISSSLDGIGGLLGGPQVAWGSVFDGHGGTHACNMASSKMHKMVESESLWRELAGICLLGSTFLTIDHIAHHRLHPQDLPAEGKK